MPNRTAGATEEAFDRPARAGVVALAILIPVAVYVVLAARWIAAGVGYQVDEGIYVESAAFVLRGSNPPPYHYDIASWVSTRGRRWPLMIIPYVGTAKAAVALPLFAVFGISAPVARATGVVLAAIGIAGLVALLVRRAPPVAGLIAGLLIAIHPSFLAFTVFDNGGASVWMGSLGLLALALDHHVRWRSTRSAFLLGLTAGAGIWARMNFLWLLAAAALAAIVTWGRSVLPSRRHALVMTAGAFVGSLPLLAYEAGSRLATLRFLPTARRPLTPELVVSRLTELAQTLISDPEQRAIWAGASPTTLETGLGAAFLAATVAAVLLPARRELALSRWRRTLAVSALALAGIMAVSRLKISPHHLVGVLPLAIATLVVTGAERAGGLRRGRILAAGGAVALAFALLWLAHDAQIERALRSTRGTGVWSSAVDDVRERLRTHPVPPEKLKILSWGFQANLYVGSGGTVHGTELFWTGTREHSSRGKTWPEEIDEGGTFLLYLFPTGDASLDASAAGFREALARSSRPRAETVFRDRSGSPVALLVEIAPRHAV